MKTRILTLAVASLVLSVFASAVWSQCAGGTCKLPHKPVAKVKCPVDRADVTNTATAPKSVRNGATFTFCSAACKAKFDKDPAKYTTKSASKSDQCVCPVTGKRISKSSKTLVKSVYNGKTYCFANAAAKAKFDKDPQKYVAMPANKPVSAVCPVMKEKMADVSKAYGKSVYKGKTYYFCCRSCKTAFDKDPEKYIKK